MGLRDVKLLNRDLKKKMLAIIKNKTLLIQSSNIGRNFEPFSLEHIVWEFGKALAKAYNITASHSVTLQPRHFPTLGAES